MTNFVGGLCKVLSTVFTFADMVKDPRPGEGVLVFKPVIEMTQAVGVAAAVGEGAAKLVGASNSTLQGIKLIEVGAKIAELYVNFKQTPFEPVRRPVLLNFLINKIAAPVASLSRLVGEFAMYGQKAYLDMSPDELAKQCRQETCETGLKNIPITRKECEEELQDIEKELHSAIVAEMLLKSYTLFSTGTYRELGEMLVELAAKCGLGEARDQFDVLALSFIPEALHEDPVFEAHVCPITLAPIRHPVGDPNGITIYERDAILNVIALQGRSPITRLPLHVQDLVPQPELQLEIDNRLRFHEVLIRQEMAAHPAE